VELSDRNFDIAETVQAVAAEVDRTPAQVALSWVRRKRTIPIIGARTLPQMQDNLAAIEVSLTDDQMARLDTVSAVSLGFPHDFLRAKFVNEHLHAGVFDRIKRSGGSGR
jgi:aryl-alcohol dehydrogenase-like predicted oxidoreductase